MKFIFFVSPEKYREHAVASSVVSGLNKLPNVYAAMHYKQYELGEDCDVAIFFGIKSSMQMQAARAEGKQVIVFDKGYFRGYVASAWRNARFAVNNMHPGNYLYKLTPSYERLEQCSLPPYRVHKFTKRNKIIVAASSKKYHAHHELPPPNVYYKHVVDVLRRELWRCDISLRLKKSDKSKIKIEGATIDRGETRLRVELEKARALVTHGSNAAIDAIIECVPSFVLGPCTTQSISENIDINTWSRWYNTTSVATPAAFVRHDFLSRLVQTQWSNEDFRDGDGAQAIMDQLELAK